MMNHIFFHDKNRVYTSVFLLPNDGGFFQCPILVIFATRSPLRLHTNRALVQKNTLVEFPEINVNNN